MKIKISEILLLVFFRNVFIILLNVFYILGRWTASMINATTEIICSCYYIQCAWSFIRMSSAGSMRIRERNVWLLYVAVELCVLIINIVDGYVSYISLTVHGYISINIWVCFDIQMSRATATEGWWYAHLTKFSKCKQRKIIEYQYVKLV